MEKWNFLIEIVKNGFHFFFSPRCNECGKVFKGPHGLSGHIKQQHQTEKVKRERFICDICKRTFITKMALIRHIELHIKSIESKAEDQYEKFMIENFDMSCDRCSTVFISLYDAQRHYKQLHSYDYGYLKYAYLISSLPSHPHSMRCVHSFSDAAKWKFENIVSSKIISAFIWNPNVSSKIFIRFFFFPFYFFFFFNLFIFYWIHLDDSNSVRLDVIHVTRVSQQKRRWYHTSVSTSWQWKNHSHVDIVEECGEVNSPFANICFECI